VIDAKDLGFVEHFVQPGVEFHGARKVHSERFFHDDARSLDQLGFAQLGREPGSWRP
jgi:hypothetical protein